MDWNKTKTVFILAFLILDIFLMNQLVQKNKSKYEYIAESSIEEKLAAEDITYVDLPKSDAQETYIIGKKKYFKKGDFTHLSGQTISLISDNAIISILDKPIAVDDKFAEKVNSFLKKYVLAGDTYTYWNWDKEKNKLLFFQTYKGKPIYYNESGMIAAQLDGENRIIGYEQTMLENIEEIRDEGSTTVLHAEKALESLYNKNYLPSKSKVTGITLGYSKVVPVSGDVQFFAPTWHIIVNGKTNYFVNAMEGQIMELIQSGVEKNDIAF